MPEERGCRPPPIPHPMATGQLAIRLVNIDLPFLHEGGGTSLCSTPHCVGGRA